jgi:phosphoribosylanthranilate isomerase
MTKVKICGITNLEDALVAVEAGADLLGFIFYEPSPRYVGLEMVREIVAGGRGQVAKGTPHVTFIGVFVNTPLDTVAHILDFCQLDAAQLHGEESPRFVRHFQGRAFKALRPQSQEEAETLVEKYKPSNLPTFQPSNLPPRRLPSSPLRRHRPCHRLEHGCQHRPALSDHAGRESDG